LGGSDPLALTRNWQDVMSLGIKGVTLHSYRYGWAERARKAHYPERCAQENLGQNSAAVHRAYAKNAAVTTPSLDGWEELVANKSGGSELVIFRVKATESLA
jgi:hypothetical protein